MPTIDLTQATFEQAIGAPGIVLVDFWAGWCGPCRSFAPVFEAAAEQHPDISFAKVNTEDDGGLSTSLGISSIPTLMIFRDGILLYAEAGALPAPALEDLITKAQALDMDKVRAELDAQASA